jgi:hypothetical protein
METKNLLAMFALLTLAIATTAVIAKEINSENTIVKPPFIWRSKGFAISDWENYKTMKVTLLRHPIPASAKKVAQTDVVREFTKGFLTLDGKRYKLRNINFVPGKSLTADVVISDSTDMTTSDTAVMGKLSLERDLNKEPNVWIGKLSMNDAEYHAYLYANMLKIKPIPFPTEDAIDKTILNNEE